MKLTQNIGYFQYFLEYNKNQNYFFIKNKERQQILTL